MMNFTEDKFLKLDATILFETDEYGDNNNVRYCHDQATFTHSDYDSVHSQCEFILYIGDPNTEKSPRWISTVETMRAYNCSEAFIDAYVQAKDLGAVRLLLWN